MNGRKPSNGPAHVMPPTQTLPPSSDRAKKPPFDITGAQLSQIKEIRASNLLAAYQPQSPTSRVIPHADESEYGMTIHHNSMTMSHLKSLKIKARLLKTGHLTNIQHWQQRIHCTWRLLNPQTMAIYRLLFLSQEKTLMYICHSWRYHRDLSVTALMNMVT